MADLTEVIYCADQIKIPINFPHILKLYAKAAIRTQPYDLLRWSTAYFRALAEGNIPPAKARLEYPLYQHPSRITPGYLKALLNQYGHVQRVTLESLLTSWHEIGFSEPSLYQILTIGQFLEDCDCDFYQFLAIACGLLGNSLFETMVFVCELLTEEPEGGSAMIPLETFLSLYGYLANLSCTGEPEVPDVSFCESASKDEEEEKEEEEEEEVKEEKEEYECSENRQIEKQKSNKFSQETISDLASFCTSQINHETSWLAVDESSSKDEVTEILEDEEQPREDSKILEALKFEENDETIEEDEKEITENVKETVEDEKNPPEIVILFDHCDQRTEMKLANDDLLKVETQRNSFESENGPKNLDDEEKEVKSDDERKDDDYSFSFKGEETETSSFNNFTEPNSTYFEKVSEGTSEHVEVMEDSEFEEDIGSPLDPVKEFLNRMKVQFSNPCELLKVAGIGPKVGEDTVAKVGLWLRDCSRRQNGVVGPRNMRHLLCPYLDDHPTHEDYKRTKLECP